MDNLIDLISEKNLPVVQRDRRTQQQQQRDKDSPANNQVQMCWFSAAKHEINTSVRLLLFSRQDMHPSRGVHIRGRKFLKALTIGLQKPGP